MKSKTKIHCSLCENEHDQAIEIMFDYPICPVCKKKLRLHADKTLKKYIRNMNAQKEENPEQLSFKEDMERRLEFVEKDYIKKKIKISYILDRIDLIS